MRHIGIIAICALAGIAHALAFDAEIAEVLQRQKLGKPVNMTDATQLMLGAEAWCYDPYEGECAWSEIFLSVTDNLAIYESSNAWDDVYDIHIVSQGELRENRYICDFSFDWRPSMRFSRRSDGTSVNGREYDALSSHIRTDGPPTSENCYDYVYRSAEDEVVTLTMRQFIGGEHVPELDEVVELYFDHQRAAALTYTR